MGNKKIVMASLAYARFACAASILALLAAIAWPASAQSVSNTATVSPPSGVVDPTPGNNSATDTDPVVSVSTSKTSSPASGQPVAVNGTIGYTLSVNVTGGALPVNIALTDTLSAGQTLVAASLPSACTSAAGSGGTTVVTCTLAAGALPAGNPHTFAYSATVNADATGSV